MLATLPALVLRKTRYSVAPFGVDVFEGPARRARAGRDRVPHRGGGGSLADHRPPAVVEVSPRSPLHRRTPRAHRGRRAAFVARRARRAGHRPATVTGRRSRSRTRLAVVFGSLATSPVDSRRSRRCSQGEPCRPGTSPTSGRSSPTSSPTHRRRSRATGASPGASSTGGPTASPARCSTPGAAQQDKVAQYLYNCPEYLESMFARLQGRARRRSTPTTATPTTSSSTCGTTPTPSPSSSTARSPSASSASATGCRRCSTWLWVDDGSGPCPDWADPLRGGRARRTDRAGRRAVGPRRRRPLCSTPAAPPACPRA